MLEDSISCSPGNDKKPLRSRRFYKKSKRKSQRLSSSYTANNTFAEEMPCLESLYEESEHTTQYEHFNPFQNERILCAADVAEASTSRPKLVSLISQGFVKLEELPERADNRYQAYSAQSQPSPNAVAPAILGPETQFGITESEFGRFCDEVEIDVEPQDTGDTKTPKGPKSIVDAILQDFCGSPYSESPPRFLVDDATPIFRFKSKTLRTYSSIRHRKSRRNIVAELENVHELDGNTSDSSGLSVQEDLSQSVVPPLDTVDLNNSIRVCENLLNLSSTFSQECLHGKSSQQMSDEKENLPLSAIMEDIVKIRRKQYVVNRSPCEKFYGFSDVDSDSDGDTLKELLEDEDDVLQQINCDSLCYEKVVPKVSFAYNCSEVENAFEDVNTVIEEAKKLILSIDDLNRKGEVSSSNHQPNCDKHEYDPTNSAQKSEQLFEDDEPIFDEIDLWNDNEFLLNYKTQKPARNERCLPQIDDTTLNIASEKYERLLKEFHNTDLEEEKLETHNSFREMNKRDGVEITSEFRQNAGRMVMHPFDVASTSKHNPDPFKKPIEIVSTIARADEIKPDIIMAEGEVHMISGDISEGQLKVFSSAAMESADKPTSLGFSTASRKPIAISVEAKRRAAEMLLNFEQDEGDNDMTPDKVKRNDDILHSRQLGMDVVSVASGQEFQGFSTASSKPIAVSVEAKRKAKEMLIQFEKAETERLIAAAPDDILIDAKMTNVQHQHQVSSTRQQLGMKEVMQPSDEALGWVSSAVKRLPDNPSPSTSLGFSTASRKSIAISAEARRKACEILAKFDQEEREKLNENNNEICLDEFKRKNEELRKLDDVSEEVKRKAQELLMDYKFFEEAFEEELRADDYTQFTTKTCLTSGCGATNMPIVDGFKTASKKSIQISEAAKRHANQLLGNVENEDLPAEFLKCIQADLDNDAYSSNAASSVIGSLGKVEGATKNPQECQKMMSKIERKYTHADEASSDVNGLYSTLNHSIETGKTVLENAFDQAGPAFARINEITREFDKDTDSSSQEYDITGNLNSLKRKRRIFCTAEPLQETQDSPRRLSCSERTPLNCIENAILHKTSSLNQIKSNPKSFISRKNLLSLSKRKKFNSPSSVGDASARPKTPDKVVLQSSTPQCNAIGTPNLKEFFDSVSTSTPRLIRLNQTKVDLHLAKDSSIDTDFRQINWEESNNSIRGCRTSFNADPNVTCSEVSPSPKQRIERLKMYGEPPPISPISMISKCRPSGLRRGRSLMKP